MYLGRIVAVGMTSEGKNAVAYRVSSRSFPNREAVCNGQTVSIVPRAGCEEDLKKNPYIAYNCIRPAGRYQVASNGSHTDPITEKIILGMPPRDAIALGLLAMDYEKDAYDTPRIVAVGDSKTPTGWLGVVRRDSVCVNEFQLVPGTFFFLSTYEKNSPDVNQKDSNCQAVTAEELCRHLLNGGIFTEFTNPVTAAAAIVTINESDTAVAMATQA